MEIVQEIGKGSYATVSLVKPVKHNSCFPSLMAMKSCEESESASLVKERTYLDELKDCPDVIKCYGDSYTVVEKEEKLYNVFLEYASCGSLCDRVMNSENTSLSESEVRRYTRSILKGVDFIHKKGFVHCDMKLENILLFSGDKVKIADFGLAKKITDEPKSRFKHDIRGSPLYMAPEMVSRGEQGQAADIWAFGCLVLEMFTRDTAWTCSDVGALFKKIGVGEEIPHIPETLSDEGRDFLERCFVKNSRERWTAEMLLDHPFVNYEDECLSRSPRSPFEFGDLLDALSEISSESETESD
uniref:mitogen-activated protein kinase kinase kinase 20-like n=1 Tax=Erigeron canadensis TaxID=72917 RepID=UPI001CB8EB87|nr:mitogen-activated protein kinase kinase kinase 20-like [Erigeron canadensis]